MCRGYGGRRRPSRMRRSPSPQVCRACAAPAPCQRAPFRAHKRGRVFPFRRAISDFFSNDHYRFRPNNLHLRITTPHPSTHPLEVPPCAHRSVRALYLRRAVCTARWFTAHAPGYRTSPASAWLAPGFCLRRHRFGQRSRMSGPSTPAASHHGRRGDRRARVISPAGAQTVRSHVPGPHKPVKEARPSRRRLGGWIVRVDRGTRPQGLIVRCLASIVRPIPAAAPVRLQFESRTRLRLPLMRDLGTAAHSAWKAPSHHAGFKRGARRRRNRYAIAVSTH